MNLPTINYYYSQVVLKELILIESEFTLNIVLQGKEKFEKYLQTLWEVIEKDVNTVQSHNKNQKLKFYSEEVVDNEYIMAINLPTNNQNGDCYYICIILNEKGNFAYFTYEFINNEYQICQWINEKQHIILKITDNLDADEFINYIREVIKKDNVKEKSYIKKINNNYSNLD